MSRARSQSQRSPFRIERFASEIPAPAVALRLPWPPTVNTYWRHIVINRRPRVLISKAGRQFRVAVEHEGQGHHVFAFANAVSMEETKGERTTQ